MDSINQQQPEQNHQDLYDQDAIQKVKTLCEKKSCCFCTGSTTGKPFITRPMSVQKVDEKGNLWFLSASDSHKNQEIMADPAVRLLFQGSSHSDFASLSGYASVIQDKTVIQDLWEPILKTWFTGGIDDPRITAIR